MSNRRSFDERCHYKVWVKGLLDERWSGFFDGLAITSLEDGETLLSGVMADQAALHGLLAKIRDLGLPLLAVKRTETKEDKVEDGR
jgi:hypothetical protein